MGEILYKAEPTIALFHKSDEYYRGLMGPRASGKSTGCSMEIMRRAQEQEPSPVDEQRKTRWGIVRNTYRELQDTTMKTWLQWFDEDHFGPFNKTDMTHNIRFNDIKMEVIFRALDRPGDIKKLLSLELTGAWVNEAREIPKGIIDGLSDCVGRYPPMKDGGATWQGVMMDSNPPDEDHWWYRLAEEEKPEGWKFWRQPGALIERNDRFEPNPAAENIQNLKGGHEWYMKALEGKEKDHIRVYYCSQYGFVKEGKPVHSEYVDAIHCAAENLKPMPNIPIIVGVDFGLTPSAIFAQRLPNGRWIWIDELVTEDMGTVRFGNLLGPKLRGEYKDFEIEAWGDPAGDQRAQTDERTPFQILEKMGIPIQPAPSNDFTLRRESVANCLNRIIDGKPGLMISPKCKVTRKGMAGGYHFKRIQVSGEERYHEKPNKNKYSHPCEAGQYLMLGAGEGEMLIKIPIKAQKQRPRQQHIGPQGWMAA